MTPRRAWARLTGSFLFVPALLTLAAFGLSLLTTIVDRSLRPESWVLPGDAPSARSLLSSIASASMSLTAVVFSITMLVLQLASSQYSPRVLRTFLRDRFSQVALGTFSGTFAFSLSALRGVSPDGVPATSVSVAFVLAILTIAVFVVYVSHISQKIQVSSIIAAIERETLAAFEAAAAQHDDVGWPWPAGGSTSVVVASRAGTVKSGDATAMVSAAKARGAAVDVLVRVGDWVRAGTPLLRVHGDGDPALFARRIAVADERDIGDDPAYGLRQLVDIAERALSTGMNDPTTAVQATHAIHHVLVEIADVALDDLVTCDDDGVPRLRRPRWSFADLVDLAFDEIVLYGRHSIQVMATVEDVLSDLLRLVHDDRADVVADKLDKVRTERRRLLEGDAWFAGDGAATRTG